MVISLNIFRADSVPKMLGIRFIHFKCCRTVTLYTLNKYNTLVTFAIPLLFPEPISRNITYTHSSDMNRIYVSLCQLHKQLFMDEKRQKSQLLSCCCCCRPHSTNVLSAESSTRIMWQPAVSPPRWQGKAPLCRDSSRGPG